MLASAPRETMVMARPDDRSSVFTRNEACGASREIRTLWSPSFSMPATLATTREWIDLSGSRDRS